MELTIQTRDEKPLLKRTEITARVFFQGETPTRLDIADALAKEAKVDRKLLTVTRIITSFGETSANIEARAYSDKATYETMESEADRAAMVRPEPEPTEEEPAEEEPSTESEDEGDASAQEEKAEGE